MLSDRLSAMVQLCTLSFLRTLGPIPLIKRLYIFCTGIPYLLVALGLEDSPRLWMGLLRLFTSVEDLFLSRDFLPPIVPVPALHGPGGGITEVLPSLQNFFLERESP